MSLLKYNAIRSDAYQTFVKQHHGEFYYQQAQELSK